MIKLSEKILQLDKPNGTFIVFGEYDSEEVFTSFLDYVHQNLGAKIGDIEQQPYSVAAQLKFPFGEATATCLSGIGCSIRIEPGETLIVEKIAEKCSAIK